MACVNPWSGCLHEQQRGHLAQRQEDEVGRCGRAGLEVVRREGSQLVHAPQPLQICDALGLGLGLGAERRRCSAGGGSACWPRVGVELESRTIIIIEDDHRLRFAQELP